MSKDLSREFNYTSLVGKSRGFQAERKRPDFTEIKNREELFQLLHPEYSIDINSDIDYDILTFLWYQLSHTDKAKLLATQSLHDREINFKVFISEVKDVEESVEISLDISTPWQNKLSNLIEIFYFKNTHTITINNFFPTDLTARGYSVGRKLLKIIERFAKARKVCTVSITDVNENTAIFYVKCGYEKVPTTDTYTKKLG